MFSHLLRRRLARPTPVNANAALDGVYSEIRLADFLLFAIRGFFRQSEAYSL